jgi:uncharacterized protein (DUF4415 family)/uncharacterized DUF497 family protein
MMEIVWDETKRQSNLIKHGLDFADLDESFFASSLVVPAKGGRSMAIGRLSGGVVAVVFVVLGVGGSDGHLHASRKPQGKEHSMTVKSLSDAEEARIQAGIALDPDAPEATDAELAQARPFAEAFPALAATVGKGGRPRLERPKRAVSIRLDQEVLDRFRAEGPGWQSRINAILRRSVGLG